MLVRQLPTRTYRRLGRVSTTNSQIACYATKQILTPAEDRRQEMKKFEQQMTELRKQYKTEYDSKKKEQDKKSVKVFDEFRRKVLEYRQLKHNIALKNIQRHQDMTDILSDERERFFREKYQRRLNIEASKHARIQANLRQMSKESAYYITPENLDRHIERELNPSRVLIGNTIFGQDKFGVNDEVALEVMRYRQYQNRMNNEELEELAEAADKKKIYRVDDEYEDYYEASEYTAVPTTLYTNPVLYENKYITDLFYPYVRILRDNVILKTNTAEEEDEEREEDEEEGTQIDLDEYSREMMDELTEIAEIVEQTPRQVLNAMKQMEKEENEQLEERFEALSREVEEFEAFEEGRRNPNPKPEAQTVSIQVNADNKPAFYRKWLDTYPNLAQALAETVSKQEARPEITLASLAYAMEENDQVRSEFNSFLSQFLPADFSLETPVSEETVEVIDKTATLHERVEYIHKKLTLKFGDELLDAKGSLKDKISQVREYLTEEGFSSETTELWCSVIESRILNKQIENKTSNVDRS